MPLKNKKKRAQYLKRYLVAWNAANAEKIVAYQVRYRRTHRAEINARRRAAYPRQKEKILAKNRRYGSAYHAISRYGVSPEFKLGVWIIQNKCCAGCGQPVAFEDAHIDHCHITNKFRGLLHGLCNRALGLLRDNPEVLRKLANYLQK